MTILQFPTETDQKERIRKLRAELEKIGGSIIDRHERLPPDMEEEFLRHILEYETQERMTLLKWLENSGVQVPAPDQLDDKRLSVKLEEVIYGMAYLGAYLLHTNHLSDRELYEFLSTLPIMSMMYA